MRNNPNSAGYVFLNARSPKRDQRAAWQRGRARRLTGCTEDYTQGWMSAIERDGEAVLGFLPMTHQLSLSDVLVMADGSSGWAGCVQ